LESEVAHEKSYLTRLLGREDILGICHFVRGDVVRGIKLVWCRVEKKFKCPLDNGTFNFLPLQIYLFVTSQVTYAKVAHRGVVLLVREHGNW
jgi:hypothetical protein